MVEHPPLTGANPIDPVENNPGELDADIETRLRPRRFSWPMRIFLTYFVCDMVFRSLLMLAPLIDWAEELKADIYPAVALPSRVELRQIAEGAHPKYKSSLNRVGASFASIGAYLVPWPNATVREQIHSPTDALKWAGFWLGTRMRFVGNTVGVDQNWPMFSPDVAMDEKLGRCLLHYEDGSRREVKTIAEPENILNFSHWLHEKWLQSQTQVAYDFDAQWGYCNYLSHLYPVNERGSPLTVIFIYTVEYQYPAPGTNAREFLTRQQGPPAEQISAPYRWYDVEEKQLYAVPAARNK